MWSFFISYLFLYSEWIDYVGLEGVSKIPKVLLGDFRLTEDDWYKILEYLNEQCLNFRIIILNWHAREMHLIWKPYVSY